MSWAPAADPHGTPLLHSPQYVNAFFVPVPVPILDSQCCLTSAKQKRITLSLELLATFLLSVPLAFAARTHCSFTLNSSSTTPAVTFCMCYSIWIALEGAVSSWHTHSSSSCNSLSLRQGASKEVPSCSLSMCIQKMAHQLLTHWGCPGSSACHRHSTVCAYTHPAMKQRRRHRFAPLHFQKMTPGQHSRKWASMNPSMSFRKTLSHGWVSTKDWRKESTTQRTLYTSYEVWYIKLRWFLFHVIFKTLCICLFLRKRYI